MRTLRAQFVLASLLVVSLAAGQNAAPPVTTGVLTFPIYTLNAAPVAGATITVVGAPGQTTYYYWAVANFQIGSLVSLIGTVTNSANTLSGSNYNAVYPWYYPASATSVDILRTTTPLAPTGTCNCAVTGGTGLTSGGVNDQSNSLSAYTVPTFAPQNFNLFLVNEVTGAGVSHLRLRQGSQYPGTLIADLSAATTGCGTGTNGTLMEFTGTSTCGNAPIVDGGVTGLTVANPLTGAFTVTSGTGVSGAQLILQGSGASTTYLGDQPLANFNAAGASGGVAGCTFLGGTGSAGLMTCAGFDSSGNVGKLTLRGSASTSAAPPWQLTDGTGDTIQGVPTGAVGSPAGVQVRVAAGKTIAFMVNSTVIATLSNTGFLMQNGGLYQTTAAAFSSLSACSGPGEGTFAAVTDSTTNAWGATITGSGTNHVLAYCDGTNWTVAGK